MDSRQGRFRAAAHPAWRWHLILAVGVVANMCCYALPALSTIFNSDKVKEIFAEWNKKKTLEDYDDSFFLQDSAFDLANKLVAGTFKGVEKGMSEQFPVKTTSNVEIGDCSDPDLVDKYLNAAPQLTVKNWPVKHNQGTVDELDEARIIEEAKDIVDNSDVDRLIEGNIETSSVDPSTSKMTRTQIIERITDNSQLQDKNRSVDQIEANIIFAGRAGDDATSGYFHGEFDRNEEKGSQLRFYANFDRNEKKGFQLRCNRDFDRNEKKGFQLRDYGVKILDMDFKNIATGALGKGKWTAKADYSDYGGKKRRFVSIIERPSSKNLTESQDKEAEKLDVIQPPGSSRSYIKITGGMDDLSIQKALQEIFPQTRGDNARVVHKKCVDDDEITQEKLEPMTRWYTWTDSELQQAKGFSATVSTPSGAPSYNLVVKRQNRLENGQIEKVTVFERPMYFAPARAVNRYNREYYCPKTQSKVFHTGFYIARRTEVEGWPLIDNVFAYDVKRVVRNYKPGVSQHPCHVELRMAVKTSEDWWTFYVAEIGSGGLKRRAPVAYAPGSTDVLVQHVKYGTVCKNLKGCWLLDPSDSDRALSASCPDEIEKRPASIIYSPLFSASQFATPEFAEPRFAALHFGKNVKSFPESPRNYRVLQAMGESDAISSRTKPITNTGFDIPDSLLHDEDATNPPKGELKTNDNGSKNDSAISDGKDKTTRDFPMKTTLFCGGLVFIAIFSLLHIFLSLSEKSKKA